MTYYERQIDKTILDEAYRRHKAKKYIRSRLDAKKKSEKETSE